MLFSKSGAKADELLGRVRDRPTPASGETQRQREGRVSADSEMSVWWATEVECVSAIVRQLRNRTVELEDANEGYARLMRLTAQWSVIEPEPSIRERAISLLQIHDLRAADALQLAAAFVAAEGSPSTLDFVCLDDRLTDAARLEGFGIAIDDLH